MQESARVPCQKYRLAGKAGHETSVFGPAIESTVSVYVNGDDCNLSDILFRYRLVFQVFLKREE